jgi:hypothetical protein
LNYLGHILRMEKSRYPSVMLHAEIARGARRSGGQELSDRQGIKKTLVLFDINVGKGIDPLKKLAQDKTVWRNIVRVGSEFFMDNWINQRSVASY